MVSKEDISNIKKIVSYRCRIKSQAGHSYLLGYELHWKQDGQIGGRWSNWIALSLQNHRQDNSKRSTSPMRTDLDMSANENTLTGERGTTIIKVCSVVYYIGIKNQELIYAWPWACVASLEKTSQNRNVGAKRFLRYPNGTNEVAARFQCSTTAELVAYVNASSVGELETRQ